MDTARRIGLIAIALSAGLVWVQMEPVPPSPTMTSSQADRLVEAALSDFDANEGLADSAPQQQVVNGWVARDLLQILASIEAAQLDAANENALATDSRVPALLALGVVAICWSGLFLPRRVVLPSRSELGIASQEPSLAASSAT